MKHELLFQRFFASMLLLAVSMLSWAYDVEVDGICYNLNKNNQTAEVTWKIDPNITTLSHLDYAGSIVIPENVSVENVTYRVKSIGYGAFSRSKITSIEIPNTIDSIKSEAFFRTPIRSLIIPESVVFIGEMAFCIAGIQSIVIPNSIKTLEIGIFYLSALRKVAISDGISSIPAATFRECSNLDTVYIGRDVKTLENSSFYNCRKLKDIYCYAEYTPQVHENAFAGASIDNAILHVPQSSIDAYKSADQWKDFGTIVGFDPSAVDELEAMNKKDNDVDGKYLIDGNLVIVKNGNKYSMSGAKIP